MTPSKGLFRPTSSLVRQALFDKLGKRVENSCLLDLYAGSGAICLEALSRGARRALAVESARSSLAVLRGNQMRFACQTALQVVPKDVLRFLQRFSSNSPFDWIFADPPYDLLARQEVFENLMELAAAHLQSGRLLFLERGRRFDINSSSPLWKLIATRTYGDSCLETFERL